MPGNGNLHMVTFTNFTYQLQNHPEEEILSVGEERKIGVAISSRVFDLG